MIQLLVPSALPGGRRFPDPLPVPLELLLELLLFDPVDLLPELSGGMLSGLLNRLDKWRRLGVSLALLVVFSSDPSALPVAVWASEANDELEKLDKLGSAGVDGGGCGPGGVSEKAEGMGGGAGLISDIGLKELVEAARECL